VKSAWKSAIRRAGIRYTRFHDLRHAFNCRLLEAGVMQEVRKALMGHSSGEDVHSIYTHVELPMKREAIRKLETWHAAQMKQLDEQGGSNDSTKVSGIGIAEVRTNRSETRKPWKKKTPVEVVLDQINRLRDDVNRRDEALKKDRRQLQRLEEV